MKILVVEDTRLSASTLKRGLTEPASTPIWWGRRRRLRLSAGGHYDMLVLDLRLPPCRA